VNAKRELAAARRRERTLQSRVSDLLVELNTIRSQWSPILQAHLEVGKLLGLPATIGGQAQIPTEIAKLVALRDVIKPDIELLIRKIAWTHNLGPWPGGDPPNTVVKT
jgi:hypothetical protein